MSIITGQFTYQIEDLETKTATFYLGKNDGILYLQNFDPIHPSEKESIYWQPDEYRLKLVNNTDTDDINTVPIYPIPTTFDDIIPSYETTEDTTIQKVWLYHPEFAIENTIEYIKFYIVQEVADPDISNQYSFYTLDSNNDLVVHNYDPPTIPVNKIEIGIKKSDSVNINYGTWYSMTETFDFVKFNHKEGYDYKYKVRLGMYEGILNNINSIRNVITETTNNFNSMANIIATINSLILNESDEDYVTDELNLISDISIEINELNSYIENNDLFYRLSYLPPDDQFVSYVVAPSNCSDIIGSEYSTFTIHNIELNLDLVENLLDANILLNKSFFNTIKIIGKKNNYNDSEILTIDKDNLTATSYNENDDITLDITAEVNQSDNNEWIITVVSNIEDVDIYYNEVKNTHLTLPLVGGVNNSTTLIFTDTSSILVGDIIIYGNDSSSTVLSIDNNTTTITVSNNVTIEDGTNISFLTLSEVVQTQNNEVEFNINKYTTTYGDIKNYVEQSLSQIHININKFEYFYTPFLDLRENYIKIINYFEIFTLNNYNSNVEIWFPNCDKSCLDSNLSISLKKLKYNGNISLINMMLTNIRNIYHIGKLQEYLINCINTIITTYYHNETISIDINDSKDPNLLTFQSDDLLQYFIDEIDSIPNFAVYDGSHVFSTNTDSRSNSYRFISSSTSNHSSSSNDLDFNLPVIDSSSLYLDTLISNNSDTTDDHNLYTQIVANIDTILSIYTDAINKAESKKSTFNSLKSIIDLRLKTIIDFIEYTKNLLG
tara:strand:+ start:2511 stop:4841 length:2331 start_codon:yes stop_codon:yes gene_type:complete